MEENVEQKPVEEAKPTEEKKDQTPPAEAKNTDHMIPKTRLDEEIRKRKEIEKQAEENAARLKEFEEAEAKRKEAELSETERSQKRIKELEDANALKDQQLKTKERQDLQYKVAKTVAKELGLSIETAEGLADRLKGETEEEITEDAKTVFALLPKQEAKKPIPPKIDPTNPGDAKPGETRAQIRERTLGGNKPVWGSGTVTMVEKE